MSFSASDSPARNPVTVTIIHYVFGVNILVIIISSPFGMSNVFRNCTRLGDDGWPRLIRKLKREDCTSRVDDDLTRLKLTTTPRRQPITTVVIVTEPGVLCRIKLYAESLHLCNRPIKVWHTTFVRGTPISRRTISVGAKLHEFYPHAALRLAAV